MAVEGLPERNGPGAPDHKGAFLDDATYSSALDSISFGAVDIVAVNTANQSFYLAGRKARPLSGVYWTFGGRKRTGEQPDATIARLLSREIGTSLEAAEALVRDRTFKFARYMEVILPERAQEPVQHPTHAISQIFSVEFTEEERKRIAQNLDPEEFHAEAGLTEFSISELEASRDAFAAWHLGAFNPYAELVLHWYAIFGKPQETDAPVASPLSGEMAFALVQVSTSN